MRNIDLKNTRFYKRSVIPEPNEIITADVGVALANNLYNAYGIYDKLTIYKSGDYTVAYPYGKVFSFPPDVFIWYDAYFRDEGGIERLITVSNLLFRVPGYTAPVSYVICPDRIIFTLNTDYLTEKYFYNLPRTDNTTLYKCWLVIDDNHPLVINYRVHGL